MSGHGAHVVVGPADHVVQFYGDSEELSAGAGAFLGQGLAAGGSAVVVAGPAHRAALAAAGSARAGGQPGRTLLVDAAWMLSAFCSEAGLAPAGFRDAARTLIGQAAAAGQPVRVYGEMVALLWEAGQVKTAIELEALWNDLAAEQPFSLLCGYPAGLVERPSDAGALAETCRLHTAVIGPAPGG